MANVSLQAIKKVYPNGVCAVQDFHLEIENGAFVVFVGPSGCGKSTTLRMIAGLESITEGDLFIDGEKMNEVDAKDRNIAMVFQNYALYPHLTVFENMAFSLKLRKLPKSVIRPRINAVAETLEIKHLLNRFPSALSGGERQRVALGRALVRNPKVFLFDEPLSNLDARLRTTMRRELKTLHQKLGATFVYVTHDQVEAMTMGDMIVVMKDGFIQQAAPPEEIFRKPSNLFVAKFIGSPAINVLSGSILQDGAGCWAHFGAHLRKKLSDQWQKHVGGEYLFGIRPTDIKIANADESEIFPMEITRTEHLGAESYLYVKHGDITFTVVTENKTKMFHPGEKIDFSFSEENLLLFHPETEDRLM